MQKSAFNRRRVLSGITAILGSVIPFRSFAKVARTVESTEGPFYPTESMRFDDIDNDLVRIDGIVRQAGGEIFYLKGTVTDANGAPMPGIRVEIWQCDVGGRYLHTSDPRQVEYDTGFQGFGHDITGDDGAYSFRTIKPVSYPGRAPHIHVKCLAKDKTLLTTQFYLKDDPQNSRDFIYKRLSDLQANSVSMALVDGADGAEATVDIVI